MYQLIMALLILLISGCGRQLPPADCLVVGIEANPTNLDPRRATDATSAYVTQVLFNGLLRKDAQANLVPDLALDWQQISSTGYRFTLRRGVKFHNGRELTARDVVYTFKSILDPDFKSPHRGGYAQLDSVSAVDDYTVEFKLKEPFAPFLLSLTMGIVPESAASQGDDFASHPVGTGPYSLLSWQPDERVGLEGFKAHFGGAPKMSRLTYKIIPQDSSRLLELEKGSVHILQNNIPPDVLPRLQRNPKIRIDTAMGTTYSYVGFNFSDPALKDVRVRQALALAIDRRLIIQHILGGLAVPARNLLPEGHWAYCSDVPVWEYNPAAAQKLLDEAGYPDPDGAGPKPRLTLLYKTSQNELSRRIAEVLQNQWAQVGVNVDIRSYEWGVFFSDIASGNFQLYTLKWVGVTDPDIFYNIFHSAAFPPAGANRGRYVNPALDGLLEAGRRATEPDSRRRIYAQAQQILAQELPYISLWHQANVVAMRKEVQGFKLYPAGEFYSLKDVYFQPVGLPGHGALGQE